MRNPGCLAKLRQEIIARFSSWEEINGTAARQLPYLQAVINEGLRIYPPGSQGFPRVSPGMKVGEHWIPAGVSWICHIPTYLSTNGMGSRPKFTPAPGQPPIVKNTLPNQWRSSPRDGWIRNLQMSRKPASPSHWARGAAWGRSKDNKMFELGTTLTGETVLRTWN